MPSISMGFWVAITMNGDSRWYVVLSTVTWRSSMHSSSADWVLGEARLISSPTTMLAKTPPGRNSNSRVSWLKTDTPVTSDGSRSGVNWMRRTEQSMLRASALLSIVLPTPGTSSMRRWPSASSTTSAEVTTSGLPSMTFLMLARTRSTTRLRVSRSAPPLVPCSRGAGLRDCHVWSLPSRRGRGRERPDPVRWGRWEKPTRRTCLCL